MSGVMRGTDQYGFRVRVDVGLHVVSLAMEKVSFAMLMTHEEIS